MDLVSESTCCEEIAEAVWLLLVEAAKRNLDSNQLGSTLGTSKLAVAIQNAYNVCKYGRIVDCSLSFSHKCCVMFRQRKMS